MADIFARTMNILGSEADWASNDIVILQGEIAFADVGGVILGKVGDGVSTWSQLDYTIGTAAIPLAGTEAGMPVTGTITYNNATLDKTFTVGIEEGFSVDDFLIAASGANIATSNVWVSVNGNNWKFQNDGRLTGPDITYGAGDDLAMANRKYVDSAVAGGLSTDYIPLVGTGVNPVTGQVSYYNANIDKEYQMGVVEGFGYDELVIQGTGTNVANCSIVLVSNGYVSKFENNGRLFLPAITYGAGDAQAAATKAFVDQLRQDCIDAGVAISAPT